MGVGARGRSGEVRIDGSRCEKGGGGRGEGVLVTAVKPKAPRHPRIGTHHHIGRRLAGSEGAKEKKTIHRSKNEVLYAIRK